MTVYEQRRAALAEQLGDAVAIVPSAKTRLRNADTEFEFRQASDFFYLTGFNEPDAVLIVSPQRTDAPVTLFLQPLDRAAEIWTGRRLGVEQACANLGVDAAFPIEEFDRRLADYLVGAPRAYYALGMDEAFDRRVMAALADAKHRVRRGGIAPQAFVEPGTIVHEMRLRKTPDEIETMRRAGAITRLGHIAGMRSTHPGQFEYELEATIEYAYRHKGAQDVAYPSIVAGGDNATILHYNTNRHRLEDATLVLVDSAAELDCYASDVTRTWPVNGRFTPEQRAIYEIVLAAQHAAIAEVRPGASYWAYHERAVRVITEGLIELGLLSGSVDAAIEEQTYRQFYMHNTGHWIGLDVHDAGRYRDDQDRYRTLESGMVMTVEPGIYVHRDIACDERFHGIGVRIEDDILCGDDGPVNLSPEIPKEIDEIEAIVGADVLARAR